MNLGKNFTLEELTKSETATRFDLDNVPSLQTIENLQALVDNVLQPIRDALGPVIVTSGYRSPPVNRATGGSATSDHCFGFAADIEVLGMDNKNLARWVIDNLQFKQVILEFYKSGVPDSGWVHVSFDGRSNGKQVLTAQKIAGKTVYTSGIA